MTGAASATVAEASRHLLVVSGVANPGIKLSVLVGEIESQIYFREA